MLAERNISTRGNQGGWQNVVFLQGEIKDAGGTLCFYKGKSRMLTERNVSTRRSREPAEHSISTKGNQGCWQNAIFLRGEMKDAGRTLCFYGGESRMLAERCVSTGGNQGC